MRLLAEQLDRRLAPAMPLLRDVRRPQSGWIRALRDALGLTTAQLGRRMNLSQSRIVEMEKAEIEGNLSLRNLERAADALGCHVVYVFVPLRPVSEVIEEQAGKVADRQMMHVSQTMALEAQAVEGGSKHQATLRRRLIDSLLEKRGRIWNQP